jgi:hypothetical protein
LFANIADDDESQFFLKTFFVHHHTILPPKLIFFLLRPKLVVTTAKDGQTTKQKCKEKQSSFFFVNFFYFADYCYYYFVKKKKLKICHGPNRTSAQLETKLYTSPCSSFPLGLSLSEMPLSLCLHTAETERERGREGELYTIKDYFKTVYL